MAKDNNHHSAIPVQHTSDGSKRLKIALTIVVAMLGVEIVGGILSNSLALLGDAGHMLVDALALAMSIIAIRIARRPATATRTYGYHRVEIMAALANGVILFLTVAVIYYEAYQRILEPPEVQTNLMMVVAVIGLIANLVGIRLLRQHSHGSLNIRAAFWHIVGDTISSVGVIVAGVIISVTGRTIVDPIIAMFIGGIILWGAINLVRESADILLESVPRHIKVKKVVETLRSVSGVKDVHDLHIWTITSNIFALSAHLLIEDQMVSRSADLVKAVNKRLADQFNITHTTLQIECHVCQEACACDISVDDTK